VTGVTAWYVRQGHNPASQLRQLSHKVIDYPLTELGITQATTVAGRLARERAPAVIYSSPLRHPPSSRVLIVGHGGIIRAAIPALCPGTPVPATDLPNCGIAELALHPVPAGATGTLMHWPLRLPSDPH
jgi:broad specificity phosphatase PhoE